jgi:outer membrane biosynthesis protein TonB
MRSLILLGAVLCASLSTVAGSAQAAESCPATERMAAQNKLPLAKNYEELTPEQQAIVRADYENLPAGDEPPYPIGGLARIRKELAKAQGKMVSDGEVKLLVTVDSTGTARSVAVYESPDINATKVTTFAVMNAKYKPGKCGGKPCRMDYRFDFCFDPH